MRKPRVILYDDDQIVLDVLRNFFALRNYEVLSYSEPSVCPVYGAHEHCNKSYPCSDVMITDYRMPGMSGIQLLEIQASRGCKVSPRNKAIISGFLNEDSVRAIRRLGAAYFEKPFEFHELGGWLDECESRMDLSTRIAIKRKEERSACSDEVTYQVGSGNDVRCGITVNRSRSGLCMKVSEPLARDHSVTLQIPLSELTAPAIVRWMKATSEDSYLVGLQWH